jgi:hypothetical protein
VAVTTAAVGGNVGLVSEREIEMDGQTFVCATEGDQLRIGRRTPSSVEWLETVPQDSLAGAADDEVALRGLITALVERGG